MTKNNLSEIKVKTIRIGRQSENIAANKSGRILRPTCTYNRSRSVVVKAYRPNQLRLYDRKSSGDTKVAYTFYILPIKILESASYVICSSNT